MKFKSNLEQKVYLALTAAGSFTSGFFCIKEKPWVKLFPNADKNKNAVDFYYPDLDLIIEVNGLQHYKPVGFGEKNSSVILDNFKNQRYRDKKLGNLCLEHNIYLLELHYKEIECREVEELSKYIEEKILKLIGD